MFLEVIEVTVDLKIFKPLDLSNIIKYFILGLKEHKISYKVEMIGSLKAVIKFYCTLEELEKLRSYTNFFAQSHSLPENLHPLEMDWGKIKLSIGEKRTMTSDEYKEWKNLRRHVALWLLFDHQAHGRLPMPPVDAFYEELQEVHKKSVVIEKTYSSLQISFIETSANTAEKLFLTTSEIIDTLEFNDYLNEFQIVPYEKEVGVRLWV